MKPTVYIIFESYYNLVATFASVVFVCANREDALYKYEELTTLNKDESISYYIQEWDVK